MIPKKGYLKIDCLSFAERLRIRVLWGVVRSGTVVSHVVQVAMNEFELVVLKGADVVNPKASIESGSWLSATTCDRNSQGGLKLTERRRKAIVQQVYRDLSCVCI